MDLEELSMVDQADTWSYILNSAMLSITKAYKHLSDQRTIHPSFQWVWKSYCQNKHKGFCWLLLLRNRLSTREHLRRKNMKLEDYYCVLCDNATEETLAHLFFQCPFSESCWACLHMQSHSQLDVHQNLGYFKDQLQTQFFMEVIILMYDNMEFKERPDLQPSATFVSVFQMALQVRICASLSARKKEVTSPS